MRASEPVCVHENARNSMAVDRGEKMESRNRFFHFITSCSTLKVGLCVCVLLYCSIGSITCAFLVTDQLEKFTLPYVSCFKFGCKFMVKTLFFYNILRSFEHVVRT